MLFDRGRTDENLRTQLSEVKERLADVEQKMRTMEMDWEEMYDRFRRLLARISKRQERGTADQSAANGPRIVDSKDPKQLSIPVTDRVAELNRQIRENRRASALPASGSSTG